MSFYLSEIKSLKKCVFAKQLKSINAKSHNTKKMGFCIIKEIVFFFVILKQCRSTNNINFSNHYPISRREKQL